MKILSAIAMPDPLHILTAPIDRDASASDFSKWSFPKGKIDIDAAEDWERLCSRGR